MRSELFKNTARRISRPVFFIVLIFSSLSFLQAQTQNLAQPNGMGRSLTAPSRMTPNTTAPATVTPNRVPASQAPLGVPNPDGSLPIRPGAVVNTGANPTAPTPAATNGAVVQTSGNSRAPQLIPNTIPNTGMATGPANSAAPPSNQPQRPQQVLPNGGQPFPQLTVQEAADLDRFLDLWEEKSGLITSFETEFQCWERGLEIRDPSKPDPSTYGSIRYVAPNKGIYEVLGSVVDGKREPMEDNNRTKFLSTGDKVYEYDFAQKIVQIYSVPPEQQNGIAAGGPMPFVFGAKAADLKKRYYLRIITTPQRAKLGELWLEACPKTADDAAEFRSVQLIFNDKKLIPLGFVKFSANGKESTSYKFIVDTMKISGQKNIIAGMLAGPFKPDIPPGWQTQEITPQEPEPVMMQPNPQKANPIVPATGQTPQPTTPQRVVQPQPQPQQPDETPLYVPPPSNRPQF